MNKGTKQITTEQHNHKNNTINLIGKSEGCAPSLRVITWHLPYNWGKSMEEPKSHDLYNKERLFLNTPLISSSL